MSDPIRDNSEKVREVTSALKEGKLPTTDQLVSGLKEFQQSGVLQDASQGMSVEGKKVCLKCLLFALLRHYTELPTFPRRSSSTPNVLSKTLARL